MLYLILALVGVGLVALIYRWRNSVSQTNRRAALRNEQKSQAAERRYLLTNELADRGEWEDAGPS